LLERGSLRIILDAYNANPTSMSAALEHFRQLGGPKKIAILGDMFELGPEAGSEHLAIGQLAETLGLDRLYLVGANFRATGLHDARYPDFEALKAELSQRPLEGPATVLIKGSRGMALERVLECL
jgi:UDP-N-acetylmuramoyl-tripeptide--D-alanyl-D-alanine ligase